jgi:CRISPR-associated endonuclease/helicase Cas3
MSLSIERFEKFFEDLWGYGPFPWQSRLARQVFGATWPDCIDLPTASGKTAAIDIAVFVLACQADRATNERTVGRRIFFTVNRRVIVDEAFERAKTLARKLLDTKDGILKDVADALREISGDDNAPPLDIAQLRGGIYRDRAWARSITQPIIVCTTADQLGSRLLFRGYGVSSSMQPVHAALTACDSLILLDEAHVTKAFSQTLSLLNRYRKQDKTSPPMRFVQMTATPAGNIPESKRFSLKNENWSDPRNQKLKERQEARKPAELSSVGKRSIVDEIVKRAVKTAEGPLKAIGIIVNRVQTARDIHSKLAEKHGEGVYLVIGRMRPIDRDRLQEKLRRLVGPDRPEVLDKAVFVVATQCLEVGADYDFDALFTECASIDALRQRFGRLNRKGRPIEVVAAIVTNDASLKDEDPIYGYALKNTCDWLNESNRQSIDFGIIAFKQLWDDIDDAKRLAMLAPAPDAAVLLPAHLDALCQTAPYPEPSPDVSFFIHGPQRDNAEVNVCWRADLGADNTLWPEIVGLLPPTSPECMTVPLHTVANWMRAKPTKDDADVPTRPDDDEPEGAAERAVLIWRGSDDSTATNNPRDLRPGDTVVIPADSVDSLTLGHIPQSADGSLKLDIAEQAYEQIRRQRAVRVHPSIHPELPQELRDYAVAEESTLTKARIRELLGSLARGFASGPDEIDYPSAGGNARPGLLLRFNMLLPNNDALRPSLDDDDGDGSSIESTLQVILTAHTQHVVDRAKQAVNRLHLGGRASLFDRSAHLHDIGKADVRFQAMLADLTPYEAMDRPTLLAKSGQRGLTRAERDRQRIRAQLPAGFRHEMLSAELIANGGIELNHKIERDLLLHLIAAHHGHARPFAPVVIDDVFDETRSIEINGVSVTAEQRENWPPAHRLDSGIPERFWKLTREHGWWGLAWLESILRLADQQASAAEQEGDAR